MCLRLNGASYLPVGLMVKGVAIGSRGLGFNYLVGQFRHRVATAATFLRSCVAQALIEEIDSLRVRRNAVSTI